MPSRHTCHQNRDKHQQNTCYYGEIHVCNWITQCLDCARVGHVIFPRSDISSYNNNIPGTPNLISVSPCPLSLFCNILRTLRLQHYFHACTNTFSTVFSSHYLQRNLWLALICYHYSIYLTLYRAGTSPHSSSFVNAYIWQFSPSRWNFYAPNSSKHDTYFHI
jgi:hypothetical protein